MHSLSQAMTRFTVPGTPHAPDIPVWQASRLFQSRKRETGQRWVVVLDICLYFPLQQSELLVTHCNEDVGHHFGPWLIKKLDTYARPPSDMTAHLVSIRGRSVPEVMTEMLVLQLFFITSLSLLPIIHLMPGWNFYHTSCLAIVIPQMQVIIFSSYGLSCSHLA